MSNSTLNILHLTEISHLAGIIEATNVSMNNVKSMLNGIWSMLNATERSVL